MSDMGNSSRSAIVLAGWFLLSAVCHAGEMAAVTGCAVGAEVPSFYVREITGSRPNQAICLVCRYGARPAVMVCVRRYDDRVRALLIKLDRAVEAHRAEGLRGFAMFLDAGPKLQPKLFTLARREGLSLPLTFPVETAGPRTLDLPKSAQVTVLMYRDRNIKQRFEYQAEELSDEQIDRLAAMAEEFVKETKPRSKTMPGSP